MVSPRNEAASIASLVALWRTEQHSSPLRAELLQQLEQHTETMTKHFSRVYGGDDATAHHRDTLPSTTSHVLEYVHSANVTATHPAMIDYNTHHMRGLVCGEGGLHQGDLVMSIPEPLLIHDGLATNSDLVCV